MAKRVFLIVLDSVGIGEAPDAADYGDAGSNTLKACFDTGKLAVPNMTKLGLFNIDGKVYEFVPWDTEMDFGAKLLNNVYWYVSQFMAVHGASVTLLLLCLALCVMTVFKTASYFGASAVMVPIRTGIVKDFRMEIYRKILSLPLGFFSEERKGDIIARISGDVQEVETSITASLDMLIKNPILILFYFGALIFIS